MAPRPLVLLIATFAVALLGSSMGVTGAAERTFFPIERGAGATYFPVAARADGQIVPARASRFLPIARSGSADSGFPMRHAPAKAQIGATAAGLPPVTIRSHPASIGVASVITTPAPAPILEAAIRAPDAWGPAVRDGMPPSSLHGADHIWPVDHAVKSRVTSGFGWRTDPFTGVPSFHGAVDIAAAAGARAVATAHGVVHAVGEHPRLGRYVMLSYRDGSLATYGHLKDYVVETGQFVQRSQTVGHVGSSGRSTGPHVDFSLEVDGRRVDPLPLLRRPGALAAR